MGRSTRIIRQLEQVFKPHRMTLKDSEEKKEAAPNQIVPAKKWKTLKEYYNTLFGGGQLFADFYFRGGLETQSLRKARDDCVHLFIIIVPLPIVLAPCLHSHHVRTPMLLGISWPHEAHCGTESALQFRTFRET